MNARRVELVARSQPCVSLFLSKLNRSHALTHDKNKPTAHGRTQTVYRAIKEDTNTYV